MFISPFRSSNILEAVSKRFELDDLGIGQEEKQQQYLQHRQLEDQSERAELASGLKLLDAEPGIRSAEPSEEHALVVRAEIAD